MSTAPRSGDSSLEQPEDALAAVPEPVDEDSDELPFSRVSGREYGYHPRQVEDFMAKARRAYETGEGMSAREVRTVGFDPVKGGYNASEIDDLLDRLEDTLSQEERDRLIDAEGPEAWAEARRRERDVLLGRLRRAPGERFRAPSARAAVSYSAADVDKLCDRLLPTLDPEAPAPTTSRGTRRTVSVNVVRQAVFGAAGDEPGYDEAQVDAFLDAVIEYLAADDASLSA